MIRSGQRPVVEKAVWFTETVPVFEPAPGEIDRLVVMAPGYRNGPAVEQIAIVTTGTAVAIHTASRDPVVSANSHIVIKVTRPLTVPTA